jgi:hypothetical protein
MYRSRKIWIYVDLSEEGKSHLNPSSPIDQKELDIYPGPILIMKEALLINQRLLKCERIMLYVALNPMPVFDN